MNNPKECFRNMCDKTDRWFPNFWKINQKELDIIGKALDELEQYKAIEQEFGIDLITLFKALDNGVFEKDLDNNVSHTKIRGIEKYGLCAIWHSNIPECDYTLEYKDYGKIWALTKEELEK